MTEKFPEISVCIPETQTLVWLNSLPGLTEILSSRRFLLVEKGGCGYHIDTDRIKYAKDGTDKRIE